MAMLTAYVDDSGTDANAPIAVAAGFVSDLGKWQQFKSEWRAALTAYEMENTGFHMSKFAGRQTPFRQWKQEKRDGLCRLLTLAIANHTLIGFSASVQKADYDDIVPRQSQLREKLGGHYRFCVGVCLWHIQRWLRSNPFFVKERSTTYLRVEQPETTKSTASFANS